jgi:hypothetical protein
MADQKAFPSIPNSALDQGMSLRDWFATAALAGWLASPHGPQCHPTDPTNPGDFAKGAARQAYAMADAMLDARQSKP